MSTTPHEEEPKKNALVRFLEKRRALLEQRLQEAEDAKNKEK